MSNNKPAEREGTSNRFDFPIPFDPFRLVLAVMERWKLIALWSLAACGAGAAYALLILGDTYKAVVPLQKEVSYDNYDTDPSRPYTGSSLDDEALLVKAYSADVYELAAEKLEGKIPLGEIRGSISVEQTGGRLFNVTGSTKRGVNEAYELTNAFAHALIEKTIDLRQNEARDEAEKLKNALEAKDEELKVATERVIKYSEENEIFDEHEQLSTVISNLSSYRQKREEQIAVRNAKEASMKDLVRQLKAPRGLRQAIEAKEKQLATLLADSTEENPIVKDVRASLQELNERLDEAVRGNNGNLDLSSSNMDTVLMTTYYGFEDDLRGANSLIERYDAEIAKLTDQKETLPEKFLKIGQMKAEQQEMERRTTLMRERLKDVTLYADKNAKPLVEIFQKTTPADVSKNSRFLKAIVFGGAGLLLGLGSSIGLSLFFEFFRRNVRTPFQAAIATKSAPILSYDAITGKNGGTLRNFWIRSVAKFAPDERRFMFAALGDVEAEADFWRDLFGIVESGDNRVLFMDFSERPLSLTYGGAPLVPYNPNFPAAVSSLNPHAYDAEAFHRLLENFPPGFVLLVRWSHSNSSSLVKMRGLIDRYYFLTSTKDAKLSEVEKNARNYMEILGDSAGTILVDRDKPSFSARFLGEIESWFIETRKRGAKTVTPEPAV